MKSIDKLQSILNKHKNERVIVIGTTCTGKTTILKSIKNAQDMDDLIFPLLSKEENEYVCQSAWTEKVGETMTKLVKERVKVEIGRPLFGTVVLDCDFIIYLDIEDTLLEERCKKRKANFTNAKNMQKMILKEIQKSRISSIKFQINSQ